MCTLHQQNVAYAHSSAPHKVLHTVTVLVAGLIDDSIYEPNCSFVDPTVNFSGALGRVEGICAVHVAVARSCNAMLGVTLGSTVLICFITAQQLCVVHQPT